MKRLAFILIAFALLCGCGETTSGGFLDRYVDGDGRVVRHDQGGDTVSEGQAYAMLLSVAADDRSRFDRVWGWTRAHLRRSDGLLRSRSTARASMSSAIWAISFSRRSARGRW